MPTFLNIEAFINKLFLPWFLRMFQPSRPPSTYKTPPISDPLSHIGKFGATIISFKLLTCSSRSVFFPHEARYLAAELPSTPAPTTQTSKRSPVIAIMKQPWNGDSTNKRTGDSRESARFYPYLQVQIWLKNIKTRFACSLINIVVYKRNPSSKTGSFSSSMHNVEQGLGSSFYFRGNVRGCADTK